MAASRHPLLLRLLLLAAGTLVALVAAEALVRVAGLAPELVPVELGRYRLSRNPRIGYEPIPGARPPEGEYAAEQSAYDYRSPGNRLGYRDVDHAQPKPPGTTRIVVLGDSIAAGLLVSDYARTFPARLQAHLRQEGVPAEVINLGVKGYATVQEVATLQERGLPFSPDHVVLAYCLNDAFGHFDRVMERLMEQEDARPGTSDRLVRKGLAWSALYRFLHYRLRNRPRTPEEGRRWFEAVKPGYEGVEEGFSQLAELAAEHDFQPLVVMFPFEGTLDGEDPAVHFERARTLAERFHLPVLDLRPAFARCEAAEERPMTRDGMHPGEAGHDCAARAIAEEILDHDAQEPGP